MVKNPYMSSTLEVKSGNKFSNRKDFILKEGSKYSLYTYGQNAAKYAPVFMPVGYPMEDSSGRIIGSHSLLQPNMEIPIDVALNPQGDDDWRKFWYPLNIAPVSHVSFFGPRATLPSGKLAPSLSFIADTPPEVKASHGEVTSIFDILINNSTRVIAKNPHYEKYGIQKWQATRNPNTTGGLVKPTISYFMPIVCWDWHGKKNKDSFDPELLMLPMRKTTFNFFMNLATTINPKWDRSKVRTHSDLLDPANPALMYDFTNNRGPSPRLTMVKKEAEYKNGVNYPQHYKIELRTTPDRATRAYVCDMFKYEPDVATFLKEAYVPTEELFWYMDNNEQAKIILESSTDPEWSDFILECLKGTDIYSSVEHFANVTEPIVANNLHRDTVSMDVNTQRHPSYSQPAVSGNNIYRGDSEAIANGQIPGMDAESISNKLRSFQASAAPVPPAQPSAAIPSSPAQKAIPDQFGTNVPTNQYFNVNDIEAPF